MPREDVDEIGGFFLRLNIRPPKKDFKPCSHQQKKSFFFFILYFLLIFLLFFLLGLTASWRRGCWDSKVVATVRSTSFTKFWVGQVAFALSYNRHGLVRSTELTVISWFLVAVVTQERIKEEALKWKNSIQSWTNLNGSELERMKVKEKVEAVLRTALNLVSFVY